MNLLHGVEGHIEHKGKSYLVKAGQADLEQILAGIRAMPDHLFLVAKEINFPQSRIALPKVQRLSVITPKHLEVFERHGITELQIIIIHQSCPLDAEVLESITGEVDQHQEEAKEKAVEVHRCAIDVYRYCILLLANLKGLPFDTKIIDPSLLKEVASLGSAITRLREVVRHTLLDLINGRGRVLAALLEVEPPSEADARAAIRLMLDAISCGFWLGRLAENGVLEATYPELHRLSLEDLEVLGLAGLFGNSGAWGDQGQDGHEVRSLHMVKILREHGCALPQGLEELIWHHPHSDWRRHFIYQVSLILGERLEEDNRENEVGTVTFLGRDSKDAESEIKAELKPLA
ncbi:MAG: hypothetical protein AAB725_01060, partial [Patescibacteria group bacterium]